MVRRLDTSTWVNGYSEHKPPFIYSNSVQHKRVHDFVKSIKPRHPADTFNELGVKMSIYEQVWKGHELHVAQKVTTVRCEKPNVTWLGPLQPGVWPGSLKNLATCSGNSKEMKARCT